MFHSLGAIGMLWAFSVVFEPFCDLQGHTLLWISVNMPLLVDDHDESMEDARLLIIAICPEQVESVHVDDYVNRSELDVIADGLQSLQNAMQISASLAPCMQTLTTSSPYALQNFSRHIHMSCPKISAQGGNLIILWFFVSPPLYYSSPMEWYPSV